jgi:hypothetical protein
MTDRLKTTRQKSIFGLFLLAVGFFSVSGLTALASSVGVIDTAHKVAKVCKDETCASFGNINFVPTINANTPGAVALSITDAGLSGNAWGDEIGWINFTPTGGGVTINPTTGVLSGTAYSSVGSWINFSATGQSVRLVDNGAGSDFLGYAWVSGAKGGWLKFDCTDAGACVKTNWLSVPNRSVATSTPSTPGTGGNGGGGNGSGGTREIPESRELPETNPTDPSAVPTNLVAPATGAPAEGIGINADGGVPSPSFPQPPSDADGALRDSLSNPFDQDGDGNPDQNPPNDATDNSPASSGNNGGPEASGTNKEKRDCFWCILVDRDTVVTDSGEVQSALLKYGFVAERFEIPIPLSKLFAQEGAEAPLPDVDATSLSLSALLLLGIRRFLTSQTLRTLLTKL